MMSYKKLWMMIFIILWLALSVNILSFADTASNLNVVLTDCNEDDFCYEWQSNQPGISLFQSIYSVELSQESILIFNFISSGYSRYIGNSRETCISEDVFSDDFVYYIQLEGENSQEQEIEYSFIYYPDQCEISEGRDIIDNNTIYTEGNRIMTRSILATNDETVANPNSNNYYMPHQETFRKNVSAILVLYYYYHRAYLSHNQRDEAQLNQLSGYILRINNIVNQFSSREDTSDYLDDLINSVFHGFIAEDEIIFIKLYSEIMALITDEHINISQVQNVLELIREIKELIIMPQFEYFYINLNNIQDILQQLNPGNEDLINDQLTDYLETINFNF